ncbi:hypothetical protein CBM2589_B220216 [Cupriavidus taiwanensis]|uniref:Uncharacterized protein n=1 Tax=Cupriavidus taiwanensis TaxID=164546 RepID=A0A375BP39_9BURK|nr:hypothetical protein CBM2589_B220216 [Cupriavidus taiwanensis]
MGEREGAGCLLPRESSGKTGLPINRQGRNHALSRGAGRVAMDTPALSPGPSPAGGRGEKSARDGKPHRPKTKPATLSRGRSHAASRVS